MKSEKSSQRAPESVKRKIGADVQHHRAVIVLIAAEILVAAINIVVDLYADAS